MDLPDEYVVFLQEKFRSFTTIEYYDALREGMRGGDPAVDIVDLDGERCVVNCKYMVIMYITTTQGRLRHASFEKRLEAEAPPDWG